MAFDHASVTKKQNPQTSQPTPGSGIRALVNPVQLKAEEQAAPENFENEAFHCDKLEGHNFARVPVHAPTQHAVMPIQTHFAGQPQRWSVPSQVPPLRIPSGGDGGINGGQQAEWTRHFFPQSVSLLQAKLTLGQPNDQYEQEADRVAAQVVSRIHTQQSPQPGKIHLRQDIHEGGNDPLQMKPLLQNPSGGVLADPQLDAEIVQSRRGGQPLPEPIRTSVERAFGADFSQVRVHTDNQSDSLNRSIQAKAFTTGQDLFFRQGAYQPESRGGQELLAHELAHVVQQNGDAVRRKVSGSNPADAPIRLTTSAHPIDSHSSEQVIQRKVGFELECNRVEAWRLTRPISAAEMTTGHINQASVQAVDKEVLKKGEVIHHAADFELQADESAGNSDIEFVTAAIDESDPGRLTTLMDDIIQIDTDLQSAIINHFANGRYIWPEKNMNLAAPNPEVFLLTPTNIPPLYKMQATAGIRLDQIATLMESIGKAPPATPEPAAVATGRAEGRKILQSQYTVGKMMGAAPGLVDQGIAAFVGKYHADPDPNIVAGVTKMQADPGKIRSILALMNLYITAAGTLNQLSYPKAIAALLSRTDFAALFRMLSLQEMFMFQMNDRVLWQEIVTLSLAPTLQNLNDPLFRVTQFGADPTHKDRLTDLRRQDWIDGIPQGKDLLKISDYMQWQDDKLAQWKQDHPFKKITQGAAKTAEAQSRKSDAEYLESFGSYGAKSESVGPGGNVNAPIFEFRGMYADRSDLKQRHDDPLQINPLTPAEQDLLMGQGSVTSQEAKQIALKLLKYVKRLNKLSNKTFGA